MTQKLTIAELLRRHHDAAPKATDFIKAIQDRCKVHHSSVYHWMNGRMPHGESLMNLLDYFKENPLPEQQP